MCEMAQLDTEADSLIVSYAVRRSGEDDERPTQDGQTNFLRKFF